MIFSNKQILEHPTIFLDNNNEGSPTNNAELCTPITYVHPESEVPAVKFLGVFFDPKLNFKFHVQSIKNKISRTLFSIKQAKFFLNYNALLALYTSLIHSHLIYGIEVWGGANSATVSDLLKKQKQAIRTVCSAKYNSHTEPLFKKCSILPLPQLIEFSKLKFMHSFKFNLLPASFENMWIHNNAARAPLQELAYGNRELRNDDNYQIPIARTTLSSTLPLTAFPSAWNNFENEEIKSTNKNSRFCRQLKENMVNKLSLTPNCTRAECPNC